MAHQPTRWVKTLHRIFAPVRPRHRLVRLALEPLDSRIVPAVYNPSAGAADGSANSLRDVITRANSDGDDTITINLSGIYTLSLPNTETGQDNDNLTGDLDISSSAGGTRTYTFLGVGSTAATIQQTVLDRVFHIVGSGVIVQFTNVIITGGHAVDDGSAQAQPDDTDALGGGILNAGAQLVFTNARVIDNVASGADGEKGADATQWTLAENGAKGKNARGGGLYSSGGDITIEFGSAFIGNMAEGGNGGLGGSGLLGDSLTGGTGGIGGEAAGGAIYTASGSLSISQSVIASNAAVGGGAATGGTGPLTIFIPVATDDLSGETGDAGGMSTPQYDSPQLQPADPTHLPELDGPTGSEPNDPYNPGGIDGDEESQTGGTGGDGGAAYGGGIYLAGGSLVLDQASAIHANQALGGDGGVGGDGLTGGTGGVGGLAYGGGVFAAGGSVSVSGSSQVSENSANAGAGGNGGEGTDGTALGNGGVGGSAYGGGLYVVSGNVVIDDSSSVAENVASADAGGMGAIAGASGDAFGGGIYALAGDVLVDNGSSVSDNMATGIVGAGGGIGAGGSHSRGGGIYAGSGNVTIDHESSVSGNSAVGQDGGVGAIGGDGGSALGGGIFAADGMVTVDNGSGIDDNSAIGGNGSAGGDGGIAAGGGVYVGAGGAWVDHASHIDGNQIEGGNGAAGLDGETAGGAAGDALGGGLYVGSGSIDIHESRISGNTAEAGAGGDALGGGVHIAPGAAGLTITNSSITNNTAGGAGAAVVQGAGIYAAADGTITNSTIAYNGAGSDTSGTGSSQGGGIYIASAASVTISNSTIAYNSSAGEGGGIRNDGSLTLISTLIAGNESATTNHADLSGTADAQYSLIQTTGGHSIANGTNGNIVGVSTGAINLDTGLRTAPNGTQFLSFAGPSIAFNAGSNPDGLANDQCGNGSSRVTGGRADIGAVESAVSGSVYYPVAVASIGLGTVKVVDAGSGEVVQSFSPFGPGYKGQVNATLGDINNDGYVDIIVATRGACNGRVVVYDGAAALIDGIDFNNPTTWLSAPVLANIKAFGSAFRGGLTVTSGDVNGDGFDDIVVGTTAGRVTRVAVYSGAGSHSLLSRVITPFGPKFSGGANVAAGDVDGDGRAEVIVGAASRSRAVKVFGLVGSSLTPVMPAIKSTTGTAGTRVAAIDTNDDGVFEIATGVRTAAGVQIKVFGGTGAELARYTVPRAAATDSSTLSQLLGTDEYAVLYLLIDASGSGSSAFQSLTGSAGSRRV